MRSLSLVGMAYFGPFLKFVQSSAQTTLKQWYDLAAGKKRYRLVEFVILNLCIQCLTEFLKIKTNFKIVG